MKSIKYIYKIGHGPSSSHTIGPSMAASIFLKRVPDASSFRVTLYGSLAATGKGHRTDKAILSSLGNAPTEIVWCPDIVPEYHTNGMLFEAIDSQGNVMDSWTVYSIGGGTLSEGPDDSGEGDDVYDCESMTEIRHYVETHGISFWEYVEQHEGKELWDYLSTVWAQMRKSIDEGLADDSVLPGYIMLRSKAKQYNTRSRFLDQSLGYYARVSSYALAVSEQNARGAVVVTAPTCGSCGVLPAVLRYAQESGGYSENDILKALATAGLFGNIIKTNASISGAEVGCQGEVGSACVMAAAAMTQLLGGFPQQVERSAEMAMEHNLGLTCDPIGGLVLIPCIERNAFAAMRALDICIYCMLGDGKGMISFDKVVEAMKRTGKDIPPLYKETARGGLATVLESGNN